MCTERIHGVFQICIYMYNILDNLAKLIKIIFDNYIICENNFLKIEDVRVSLSLNHVYQLLENYVQKQRVHVLIIC